MRSLIADVGGSGGGTAEIASRPMRWCDNHCHLTSDRVEDADERIEVARPLVEAAWAAGVDRMITVGTSVTSSIANLDLAAAFDGVWASAGVHPHDAKDGIDGLEALFAPSADAMRPVAVGECGLDYFYEHSDREIQKVVFAQQIALAADLQLPLIVHTRDAWEDTFEILDRSPRPTTTIMHCFTGGPVEAEACLERGFVLSFSGIVTFPKAPDVAAAAMICPLESMMVETDSPYLAPVPFRGKRNQPAWVSHVGEFIAHARGVDGNEIAEATWQNAARIYGLDGA